MPIRKTKELYIEQFIQKYGSDRYDYSLVEYVNNVTKVKIICNIGNHGIFFQTPANHLHNEGCLKCKEENIKKYQQSKLEEYINISSKKFNNFYSYRKFIYINNATKGIITCPKHGEFLQDFSKHVECKIPCESCAGETVGYNGLSGIEEFIIDAKKEHGDKYKYHKYIYINCKTPGIIICDEHGDFLQSRLVHICNGSKCPDCANIESGDKQRWTKEEFEIEANKNHNNKYTYPDFIYLGAHVKGLITCKQHGNFLQSPDAHIHKKSGCPKCNDSHGERIIRIFLENNNIKHEPQFKFNDCINIISGRKLIYDFYINKYSAIIEFDGIYHYSPEYLNKFLLKVPKYLTKERYLKNNYRDELKNKYCKDKNIPLLRIPYFNFNCMKTTTKEEIETLIKNFINSLESDKL